MAGLGFIKGITTLAANVGGKVLGTLDIGKKSKKQQNRAFNQQAQLNREAAELNYRYGEMSAEEAYRRTRELRAEDETREDTAIQRQVADAQAAGLSPSVFGGMNGAGGGGGGGAPQGTGARGLQATDAAAIEGVINEKRALNIDAQRARVEKLLAIAEAKKLTAEARSIDNETTREGQKLKGDQEEQQARIGDILEDVKNKKVLRAGYKLDNAFNEIRNEIQKDTKDVQVWKIEAEWEEVQEKVKGLTIDNDIKEQIEEDLIEAAKQNVINLMADTVEKQAKTALTNEQREQLKEYLENDQNWYNLSEKEFEEKIRQFGINLKEAKKNRRTSTVNSLLGVGGLIIGGKALRSGKQKVTERTVRDPLPGGGYTQTTIRGPR